ncbi:MAG: rod shape-determining protein RodA [Neisseriaceae bacterium]
MIQKIKLVFNKIGNLFNFDKTILLTLLLLCIINVVVQYSATDKDIARLINDSIYMGVSFIILIIFANLNLNHIKALAKPMYVLSILLLICVMLFGVSVNGAKRWLNIGFRIQPSEIAKLAVPLILSYYFSIKAQLLTKLDYIKAFVLLIIPAALIIKQPDLGTSILVFSAGFYVLFFAGLSWRVIIFALIVFICSTPLIWHFLHPYQQHRILTLIHPQSDPLGKGYHLIQGMVAIGSGGLWGKGYLQGTQTHLNFIPEKDTDFVITVIAEEFGYIGVCILLLLYLVLIIRGIGIMRKAEDMFSKTLAGSIVMSFTTYIMINMSMVAGIMPVVGVPLPFISHGGTATSVIMAGFGILLAIARKYRF